jgi:hypothetical protein
MAIKAPFDPVARVVTAKRIRKTEAMAFCRPVRAVTRCPAETMAAKTVRTAIMFVGISL